MRFVRPPLIRIVIATTYVLATSGLLILAFDGVLFDRWAIAGASIGTLVLLAILLATGHGPLYLGVGGSWIYAAIIELLRGPAGANHVGMTLVFVALAFGALAAYTAYRREAPLRR